MTRYLQLQDIKDEIDRVAPLYDLYSEQVAFAESKASMLWADLDVSSLQKGADELHKRLGKLKDLKGSARVEPGQCLGMALAARVQGRRYWSYVLVGDGCLNEGQTWEAIMAAAKLVEVIDKPQNRFSVTPPALMS